MKKVKLGIIGLGQRGAAYGMADGSIGLLGNILGNSDNVIVTALCDLRPERIEAAAKIVTSKGHAMPFCSTDYNDVLKSGVDAVIVSTSWDAHVEIALASMKAGVTVAIEVGGAHGLEECWELVNCYEETKTPFMFLENCCYNRDELLATSLVRNGALGNISYCQGYYAHDVREEIASGIDTGHYRLKEYMEHNCENYPTHELGPIAKILDINSGNRFVKLVSMSSKAQGMHEYIMSKPEYRDRLGDAVFKQGDVTTTMIQCENGETVFLKLDTTLPRLYERGVTVSGTGGYYNQTLRLVVTDELARKLESAPVPSTDIYFNQKDYEKDYLVDDWKNITPEQTKAGHGGMDFIMLKHFIKCVAGELPMPIDVYDAVSWMAVTALSEESIKGGSVPVEFPDFTRGKYKERKTVDVIDFPKVKQ